MLLAIFLSSAREIALPSLLPLSSNFFEKQNTTKGGVLNVRIAYQRRRWR